MVVFCCGECGEAMKKAQVEGHYNRRCRSCNVVSCLDCGKDFWGKDYEQHTKCISEEEKYSGKNYVAKPNANKGEVKQQNWIQQVQDAIDKNKTNPRLKNVLERMKEYPNIPRKKAKFENFLKNSLRVNDKNLGAQIWDLLMTNTEQPKQTEQSQPQNGNSKENTTTTNKACAERLEHNTEETKDEPAKPLSKREKKEERRKKANKTEKKDKSVNGGSECNGGEVRKKCKKRKRREEEDEEEEEAREEATPGKRMKQEEGSEDDDEEETAVPQKKVFKTKFKWNDVIIELLRAKGEMKLKKLKRKVVSEYLAQGCTAKSEEKLWAKFDSKLKRNPVVKVLHDRAKLVE